MYSLIIFIFLQLIQICSNMNATSDRLKSGICRFSSNTKKSSFAICIRSASFWFWSQYLQYFLRLGRFIWSVSSILCLYFVNILVRVLPITVLWSALLMLWRNLNPNFLWLCNCCENFTKRVTRVFWMCFLSDSGSIRNRCVLLLRFNIFLISTFQAVNIFEHSVENKSQLWLPYRLDANTSTNLSRTSCEA